MFLKRPVAWKVDETSENIVEMDFDEWKNRHSCGLEDQEMLKRFDRLTLDGISKRVYQLKDMAKNFAKEVFPDEKGLTSVPANFPERLKVEEKACVKQLEQILKESYKKGFLMMDKSWSGNVALEPAPTDVVCDILVMSHNNIPRMITVVREYSNKVQKYNLKLAKKLKYSLVNKGGCLECIGIDAKIILLKDINDKMKLLPIVNYPTAYKMTQQLFTKIREALVIVVAGFESSSFNPTVGVNFMYVLTPEQYNISIKEDQFVIVSAPPGTGKTVVAIERIKRLRSTYVSEGEILYICENVPLASCVESLGICISYTRATFMWHIRKYGYDKFNSIRHVVVDEAQNFHNKYGQDWFRSILSILNWTTNSEEYPDNTSLYIFFDKLQKIRFEVCGLHLNREMLYTKCELGSVIRNSRKIYEEWEKIALEQSDFKKKNQLGIAHDYEGRDVNVIELSSNYGENEIFEKVKETINKILLEKSYKASDVAILFNTKNIAERFNKHLHGLFAKSGIRVTDAEAFPRRGLVVDSFRRFSGLEAPVVIAVAPKPYPNYENRDKVKIFLYSRAMVELYIIK